MNEAALIILCETLRDLDDVYPTLIGFIRNE